MTALTRTIGSNLTRTRRFMGQLSVAALTTEINVKCHFKRKTCGSTGPDLVVYKLQVTDFKGKAVSWKDCTFLFLFPHAFTCIYEKV